MNVNTISELDIDGRPDDWNRMEFEVVDPQRTMTQVIRERIDAAHHAYELEREGRERRIIEADCPLCGLAWPTAELPTHVGSFRCSQLLVDKAVEAVIIPKEWPAAEEVQS
jgi:hypothetical protein